jgi:hypothetical protein
MYLAERLLIKKKKKNFRGRLYSAFTRNLVTLILKSNLDVDFFFFFFYLGHTWMLIIRSILMILDVLSTMSQKSHELLLVWTLHCILVEM